MLSFSGSLKVFVAVEPCDTREVVSRKLHRASMSANERALASLPNESRTAAVAMITAGMESSVKSAYLAGLRKLGISVEIAAP